MVFWSICDTIQYYIQHRPTRGILMCNGSRRMTVHVPIISTCLITNHTVAGRRTRSSQIRSCEKCLYLVSNGIHMEALIFYPRSVMLSLIPLDGRQCGIICSGDHLNATAPWLVSGYQGHRLILKAWRHVASCGAMWRHEAH